METAQRDFYEVLGVPRDADPKRVRDAFRELTLKYHPDRNKAPEAEERYKEIAAAYAVLSDPKKRAEYDARGLAGVSGYSPEDLYGGIDFGELFRDFGFGLGGADFFERFFGGRRGPPRGADIEVGLVVPIERIHRGGEETVRYARLTECDACQGSGAAKGTKPKRCAACDGTGRRVLSRRERRAETTAVRVQTVTACPDCGGRGEIIEKPCQACAGRGRAERIEQLEVRIPPGAEEGMALRVASRGLAAAARGGAPGDLYVIVRSAPDPRFERRGADLWRTETLEVAEAVLGTKLRVPTLEGDAEVTVPPGTQPCEVLRLRGKGLAAFGGSRGDLNVRIEVRIPERPSAEERSLYQRLLTLGRTASRSRRS